MSIAFDSRGEHSSTVAIATSGSYQELLRFAGDRGKGTSFVLSYTGGPQTKIRLVGYIHKDDEDGVELAVSDGTDEDFATASDLIVASFPAEPAATAASTDMLFCLGGLHLAEIGIEVWVSAAASYSVKAHSNA
jgi:hypothetical protein